MVADIEVGHGIEARALCLRERRRHLGNSWRDLGFGRYCAWWTVILGVRAVGEHVAFIQGAERLALDTAADRWVSDGRCA